MISYQSIMAVNSSANQLADTGLAVIPVASSPLAELSGLCQSPWMSTMTGGTPESKGLSTDIVDNSMQKGADGTFQHDEMMESYVTLAGRIVSGNLNIARNIVNPMITSVVERAIGYADTRLRDKATPMDIQVEYFPAPYDNPILAELVRRYADFSNNDMKLGLVFQPMAAGEIRANCMSGITRLDEDVSGWLKDVSDTTLEEIYDAVFGEKAETLNETLYTAGTRPARALIIYLLARRFKDDVQPGLNIDLNSYKEYVTELMAQAGRVVVSEIRRRADNDRTNYLVSAYPNAYNVGSDFPVGTVMVNADVYRRWLKAGGTPEAIFGAIYAERRITDMTKILGDQERYVSIWRRAVAVMKSKGEFERFNYFLEGMRQALLDQISQLPDDMVVCEDQTYRERITANLQNVKEGGVDEPWSVARKIVCRVFFPHTEAESILRAIANQAKLNPTMDIREAALLATIDVVAEWVTKQFMVTQVSVSADAVAA